MVQRMLAWLAGPTTELHIAHEIGLQQNFDRPQGAELQAIHAEGEGLLRVHVWAPYSGTEINGIKLICSFVYIN